MHIGHTKEPHTTVHYWTTSFDDVHKCLLLFHVRSDNVGLILRMAHKGAEMWNLSIEKYVWQEYVYAFLVVELVDDMRSPNGFIISMNRNEAENDMHAMASGNNESVENG